MKTKARVFICHKCSRLLGGSNFLYVKTEFGNFAFCSTCIKEGYKELIYIENPAPQIKKILADFRKFMKKFKMEIDS